MKKILLFLALAFSCIAMDAAPVGLEEARTLGQRFVSTTFEFSRQSEDLTLVYSMPTFYVFNVGDTGFVIMSADDSYRPVIAYSDESVFNPDDMAPALQEYLGGLNASRMQRGTAHASMEAQRDWESLRKHGTLVSRHGGRAASHLVQTKWNQNYPYNYCCPAAPDGPGGHVYAGCVATAASQVMKFWNHPIQGNGSHTYTPEDNPQYGPITVNFGEATYDWDNMPNTISSASPVAQLEAVGQLIYHVGVSVDMNYRPTSSGAVTGTLCSSMPSYFGYINQMLNLYRENYTHEEYMQLIINSIDMGWPMVHRGGGHAYVLDGYNDQDQVYFNWGWGGSNDGWFSVDDHNYTENESVIYNMVPAAVYNATPNLPLNLNATPADNNELSVMVSWNNPSVSLTNQPLSAIDQIVVMRNNEVVYTEDNVTPGAAMTMYDTVPCFDVFQYTVYAVLNGQRGKSAVLGGVSVGPSCNWKFVVSSTNFQGWEGSYIAIYNAAGTEIGQVTVSNATPAIVDVEIPLGMVSMAWVLAEGANQNNTITVNIKDSDNVSVFSYSGNVAGMAQGVFFEGNNGCGNTPDCGTPSNLTAVQDPDDEHTIVLNWTGVDDPGYGYVIYRDSVMIRLVVDGSVQYRDENVPVGGHCYQVMVLCEGGMNGEATNMVCEPSGGCYAPRNLDYELTGSFKCKLLWERPEPDEGLTGYCLYRKKEGGDYKRIKLLSASSTSYTDNSVNEEGDYYYKLVARYEDLDCYSSPAAYIHNPNQYFLHFYYSITQIEEAQQAIKVYPNPTDGVLKVEAASLTQVTVYNLLGQVVRDEKVNGNEMSLDMKPFGSGVYMVRVQTVDGCVTRKVSVVE